MESESNEHKLLKVYIATLEKENNARDIQRNTLYGQIDRMAEQIKRLNAQISKSTPPMPKSSKQIAQLKEVNLDLMNQITILKHDNERQTAELLQKQNMLSHIQEEKAKANAVIQKNASLLHNTNIQASSLKNQIQGLEIKISLLEQTNQQYNIKISDLEEQRESLQAKIYQITQELQKAKRQVTQFQCANEELQSLQKSTSEISNLQNIKASLEATIKRLNSKVQWYQNNTKAVQQEKLNRQANIQQMELQIYNISSQLNEYQIKEKEYNSLLVSKASKQKEILALQQTNGSLKDNKKYLQKSLKEKLQMISALEAQVYQLTNQQSNQQSLQDQINTLLQSKADADKQIALVVQINQQLKNEIEMRKQKQQGYLEELSSFRRERETFLREIEQFRTSLEEARGELKTYRSRIVGDESFRMKELSPRYRAEKDTREESSEDIRKMVLGLQRQVQYLKAKQSSRPTSMLDNSQVESYSLISNRSQLLVGQHRSPSNRISDNNQRLKMAFNKNKWESLHSKINALRNENEVLKKTLFD